MIDWHKVLIQNYSDYEQARFHIFEVYAVALSRLIPQEEE